MEDDLQKLLQGLQALTGGGDGPGLDAFVSRDAAELLKERGTAPLSEDDTVAYEVWPLDDAPVDALRATVARRLDAWSGAHAWRDAGAPGASLKSRGTHVAACITIADLDDEWLLVALLAELTRVESVACRVTAGDGEFLLVDAADELPDWLEPDAAVGRTWLVDGSIAVVLSSPGGPLPLQKSVGRCRQARANAPSISATAALRRREAQLGGPGIEACVLGRRQNARVSLPKAAWHAFRRAPRLLGPSAARAPRRSPPVQHTTEGVVRLSRATYARLAAQSEDVGAALAAGLEELRKAPTVYERELLASDTVRPEETEVDGDAWLDVADDDAMEAKCKAAATPGDVVTGVRDFLGEEEDEDAMEPVVIDDNLVAKLLRDGTAPAQPLDAAKPLAAAPAAAIPLDAAGAAATAVEAEGPDSDDEQATVDSDDEEATVNASPADEYAAQLEAELSTTEMASSFDRPDDDAEAPVDLDFNLVKNLLESVEAQDGSSPGAAALLLNELGLELPADD